MKCQITQDAHMVAFTWLEDNLEEKIYRVDTDDIIAMIEQVVMS